MLDASTVINDLNALSTASSWLSYETYQLFSHYQAFTNNLTPIEKFYTISQIQPLMRRSAAVLKYEADAVSKTSKDEILPLNELSSQEASLQEGPRVENMGLPKQLSAYGMRIGVSFLSQFFFLDVLFLGLILSVEFEGVSFTYPNKYKKALDNVNFKIEAGQVRWACIVPGLYFRA